MKYKNKRNYGFLFTELLVGLTVLGILLLCLALALSGFGRFNHYQLVRQRCTSAAQAQIDSFTVTGKKIDDKDFKRLWPKLDVYVEKSKGQNQWKGLELVKVKTIGKSFGRKVEVELSRYIVPREEK